MAKAKKDRMPWLVMGPRANQATCTRCGTHEDIPSPMPINAFAAYTRYLMERHRHCVQQPGAEDAAEPTGPEPAPGARLETRYSKWLQSDDTGISSKALIAYLMGLERPELGYPDHPRDPADFGRCLRALDYMPELKPRLAKAALNPEALALDLSPQWARLIVRWADVAASYATELPTGMAPNTYMLMNMIMDAL